MQKPLIKLRFQNGLTFQSFKEEVFDLCQLSDLYTFEESTEPDFIIFGPYGNDIPPKGDYTRIGYFCENLVPDFSVCEWAFGVPAEQELRNPKYKRIQWHGLNPNSLIKTDIDAEAIYASKTKFCNFLYGNPVPYREEFFRQLSKYKKVDAPGKRMNNMAGINSQYQGDTWSIKRQFLSTYKFTIAFENYIYPGYQTEKLYDAMLAQSIPIYCGDPNIGEIFNTESFLNVPEYVDMSYSPALKQLERAAQPNFIDIRPSFYKSPKARLQRKAKAIGRNLKMTLLFKKVNYSDLIDQIIHLDKNPDEYIKYMQQPWFNNNQPPAKGLLKDRWVEIFNSKI